MKESLPVEIFDDIVFGAGNYIRTLELTSFKANRIIIPELGSGMIVERIAVGPHEQVVGNWHYYVANKDEIFKVNTLEYSKNRGEDKRPSRRNLIVEVGMAELERAIMCATEGEEDPYRYEAKILVRKKWWER